MKTLNYTDVATTANYPNSVWDLGTFQNDVGNQKLTIIFNGYASSTAQSGLKKPIATKTYILVGTAYTNAMAMASQVSTLGAELSRLAFAIALSINDQGPITAPTNFFAGATDAT